MWQQQLPNIIKMYFLKLLKWSKMYILMLNPDLKVNLTISLCMVVCGTYFNSGIKLNVQVQEIMMFYVSLLEFSAF